MGTNDKTWSNEVAMNVYVSDLRESIIKPCLITLGDYSCNAVNLLAGTAMQECQQDQQFYCAPPKRGLGIYRITPEKHRDVWDKYLIQFPDLASAVRGFASQQQFFKDPHGELIGNLNYATVVAWMIYRAANLDMNRTVEVNCLAQFWALHFDNGTGCARNIDNFMATYRASLSDCKKLVA